MKTEDCAEKINQLISEFLVENALPFQITELPFFIEMIESLNKAHVNKLQKRDIFCTRLLHEIYESTPKEIYKMWKEQGNPLVTTGIDGYKDQTGDSVVNFTKQ